MSIRRKTMRYFCAGVACAGIVAGCASHSAEGGSAFTPSSSSAQSAGGSSSQVMTAGEGDATLGAPSFVDGGGTTATADGGGDSGRPARCNDAGCTCFNIASIGQLGTFGDNTSELIDWLNGQSSAAVAVYQTKPALTADFLRQYDVIILQWLSDGQGGPYWQFSSGEIQALSDWVNAGGGLIALSGFEPSSDEVAPLNSLLSFTDISYNTDDILGACPATLPCTCWANTVPVGPWAPGPIGYDITQVGAYHGRSINPGSATVDASSQLDASNAVVYAAHETVGSGHVFAWCDEWVTYTSQWLGVPTGAAAAQYTDPTSSCYEKAAAQVYQVPQFWYNAISYAAQATSCSFTISNPQIIPR